MKLALILLILGGLAACVKDEGTVGSANFAGDETPGSTTVLQDPLASQAWHLENTGQSSYSDGAGVSGQDIDLNLAIALGYKGKGVRVAVSDTGTEISHPDLILRQLTGEHRDYGPDQSTNWYDADPTPPDADAHGTAVAGLAVAEGWNGLGSRGVAPLAKYASFRFIFDYPITTTTSSYLARNYDQMTGEFDIFNFSYGSSLCYFYPEDPDEHELYGLLAATQRDGKGSIYVQSAGNGYMDSASVDCPFGLYDNTNRDPSLATPYKIVVGAVNATGVRSSYSTPGSSMWVSAPGGEDGDADPAMVTTDLTTCSFGYSTMLPGRTEFNWGHHVKNLGCAFTNMMNGTSSAAPVLSGVIALMLEANPELTWRDVKHILATTSDKIDTSSNTLTHPAGFNLAGHTYDVKWTTNAANYNFSNWYGFGRVNAYKAVAAAKSYNEDLGEFEDTINPNTGVPYYDSGTVDLDIPDFDAAGVESTITVLHNTIIESVQVRLTTDHTYPADLGVQLVSPSGTVSRLLLINSANLNTSLDPDFLMATNAFYGEQALGTWKLRLYDGAAVDTGKLTSWKVNIMGHQPAEGILVPNMPGDPTMASTYGSSTTSPQVSFAHSTTASVIRYEVSVGTAPGLDDKSKWASIGYANSFQIQGMRLVNRSFYYVNIRAVDETEKTSYVRSKVWQVIY